MEIVTMRNGRVVTNHLLFRGRTHITRRRDASEGRECDAVSPTTYSWGALLWSSLADNNNFRESFEYTQLDVYAMTEMNTHWRNLPDKDKLHERMVTWFQARHESLAYNMTSRPKRLLRRYGGVGLISINKLSNTRWEKVLALVDWAGGARHNIAAATD